MGAADSDSPSPFHESPDASPTKRQKTLSQNSPSSSSPRGKSKIEQDESVPDNCGICLSQEGTSIRGSIDSCDHYFCFVCIMEWAKVESRCPLCKRRFSAIRRPPQRNIFLSERIVKIPVRDQVYCNFGNSTIGPPNPYSEVLCSVCSGGSDDHFLLLCDLCDCAAHTYCVGLGANVPEGDWFCHDCTISRDEHSKSQVDLNCDEHTNSEVGLNSQSCTNFENSDAVESAAEASVSIFDIVRESNPFEERRPRRAARLSENQLPSVAVPHGDSVGENETSEESRRVPTVGHASTTTEARTLQRCRNVQAHIQVLRANWDALRSGSLSFSSSSGNRTNAATSGRPGQRESSSSSSHLSTSQNNSSSNLLPNKGPYDVDRAWKMMDVASKSIARRHKMPGIVHQTTKHSIRKINSQKEADNTSKKFLAVNSMKFNKNLEIGGEKRYHVLEKEKRGCQMFEKEKWRGNTLKDHEKYSEDSPPSLLGEIVIPASKKVKTPPLAYKNHVNGGKLPQKVCPRSSSNVCGQNDESSSLATPVKSELIASSSCTCMEETKIEKVHSDSIMNKAEDAKSEIQSLVKLNLKLLSKDKKLEASVFKEVARHATHSILAACGLELPKIGVRSFPKSVCSHADEIHQRRRSTLMPTSCRECFFVFVKDVVSTIAFERAGCSKV